MTFIGMHGKAAQKLKNVVWESQDEKMDAFQQTRNVCLLFAFKTV